MPSQAAKTPALTDRFGEARGVVPRRKQLAGVSGPDYAACLRPATAAMAVQTSSVGIIRQSA